MSKNKAHAITDIHDEYGVYGDYVITKYGSLIGAIELGGRDPDPLLPDDHVGLSFIARNIYQKVDKSIAITQYFSHFDNMQISLMPRDDVISDALSKRLEGFLNSKNLTGSHLIHYFEIFPSEKLNKLNTLHFLKHLFSAPFVKKSRVVIKESLHSDTALLVEIKELERQAFELSKTLKEVTAKWNGLMDAKICSVEEIWLHKRFLANLNSQYLADLATEHYPQEDWDKSVQSGDIEHITVRNTDMLKINGAIPKYARVASVLDFGETRISPGVWSFGDHAPLKLKCNFIVVVRWTPLTWLQKRMLFKKKRDDIERSNFDFFDMMTGREKSIVEKELTMKPAIREKVNELGEAEKMEDSWGFVHAAFLIFGSNSEEVINNCVNADKAFSSVGMKVVWETIGLPDAIATIQPCGGQKSVRDIFFQSSQLGAASLIYKPSVGQKTILLSKKEEAQYILQTSDGSVFHYSPFVGGKSLEICVGPTRSGKSFFKNTIDGHFLKYGGLLRAIDIDPGTETLAKVFMDNGAIFKISDSETQGLNIFASAKGANDRAFMRHLRTMLNAMLSANDQEDLRKLKEDEQDYFDRAIQDTLELPKAMQRLGTLVGHMPKSLARKFHRWVSHGHNKGMYADLFDAAVDAIGPLNKRVAVCNLQGLVGDEIALSLVMLDYFYRVTSAFEDESVRHIPKKLAIDEVHHFLKYPGMVDYLVGKIRTWGKYLGGISLWTQSPIDYLGIPKWGILRSSASAFIFTADPGMEEDKYKEAFGLTSGECEQIRNLQPKREVYIVQPEIGISKKVILEVDRWQHVISTSDPIECTIRNELFKQYGFEKGMAKTMEALAARHVITEDTRIKEIKEAKAAYYEN